MNNIEDAIKRCKEIINKCDDCKFATCEQCEINWTDIQAIKIVLGNLEALCDMQKSADKELENAKMTIEKLKEENLYWRGQYYLVTRKIGVIPSKKIKDKIAEIEKEENLYAKNNIIKVLQELLQKSEEK